MTMAAWGGALGAVCAAGIVVVVGRLVALRREGFEGRVLSYVQDLPQLRGAVRSSGGGDTLWGAAVRAAAERLERLVGGATSIRRRIERAGLDLSVHDFRVEQVLWGLVGFAGSAALAVVVSLRSPVRTVPLLVLCCVAFVLGVLLRENRLTAQTRLHEQHVLEELPAVAELLALAVAAGEGPVAALERVVRRSRGALSRELARVLADIRLGTPVGEAFEAYAARTGLPVVSRFADGIAVAVERGTPLADVLHAQAADVREAQRRALIESGARREVLMMVPVVFLVLPTTVIFAFWPGMVGLSLVTP